MLRISRAVLKAAERVCTVASASEVSPGMYRLKLEGEDTNTCECPARTLMGGPVIGAQLRVREEEGGILEVVERVKAPRHQVASKFKPQIDQGSDFASRTRRGWDWSSQQALRRVGPKKGGAELLPWSARADMMRRR
eukprot:Hpha_TRINITY_DN14795_c0_g1::TRINITY_DN14795_c0_g1_i1::g.102598::m.102598